MTISLNKVLEVEDFEALAADIREVLPHEADKYGAGWPDKTGYRKYWEVVMAVRALREGGVLRPDAEVLGVGAGNEPTTFYLTNHVRRVFCTDLYIPPSASPVQRHQAAKDAAQQAEQRRQARAEREAALQGRSLFRRTGAAAKQAVKGAGVAARTAFDGTLPPVDAGDSLPVRENWAESANVGMFLHPDRYWPSPWNPRRLVVQHMNGCDLQYEDDSFDGIYSSGSIEHFGSHENVRQAASEMARVLKPGGVASVSTEFRLEGPTPGVPGTLMFDEDELRELIFDAGDWEMVDGPFETRCSDATRATVDEFDNQLKHMYDHVDKYAEILYHVEAWHERMSQVLRIDERVWTSCHFALRKRG